MYSLSPSGVLTGNGRPPARSAALTSSSLIAEATQVTGRWDARPMSAVTSPPVPRLTSPPSWKVTGPRLETSTRGVSDDIGAFETIAVSQPLDAGVDGRQQLPVERRSGR